MKLIIGLGNPGKEYEKTRHNVGFMALNNFIQDSWKEKNDGLFIKTKHNQEDVIYLKPIKFMNNSGSVVKKYVDFYKIKIEDILVIYDDINYSVGDYKLKPKGSSGGHNGIKDIINKLKTEDIKRIKIGIGYNSNYNLVDYVLGKFSDEDLKKLKEVFIETNKIIDEFITNDFDLIMSKYNR